MHRPQKTGVTEFCTSRARVEAPSVSAIDEARSILCELAFRFERSRTINSFLDLGVPASIAEGLGHDGITVPLPIQSTTIPDALAGRDICAQAPTGSGKTLAFGLPLLTLVSEAAPGRGPRGLVLVPTRELAQQVTTVLSSIRTPKRCRVVAVYGGTGYRHQRMALQRGADVVVACPGRLEDFLEQGELRLDGVQTVVLDEADRMVDMGFRIPVCRILDKTAEKRQVLLFSATLSGEVDRISRRYQHEPARYDAGGFARETGDVTHHFWHTDRLKRVAITAELVAKHGQAFVFCRTKRGVDRVTRQLRAAGVEAAAIHGDRTQAQRTRALASFTAGRTRALVATDVVARGIHVDDVACVVHFDPTDDPDGYVHRSGRTGRLGSAGTVVSLVAEEHQASVSALQRALGLPQRLDVPFSDGTSPTSAPRVAQAAAGSRQRSRPSGEGRSRRPGSAARRRRGGVRSGS